MDTKKFVYVRKNTFELSKEKFGEIKNMGAACGLKPIGGLWFSEYTPNEEFISNWQRWCIGEDFNVLNVVSDAIIFTLKKSARILSINSERDFFKLRARYGLSEWEALCVLDWESIRKDYDVVYVSEDGICANYYNMYGWDIESGIVLNFDVIETQEHISLYSRKWLSGEDLDIAENPNKIRTYVYNVKLRGFTPESGFIQANSSHDAFWSIVKKYQNSKKFKNINRYSLFYELKEVIKMIYICENGEFCECRLRAW